jgi:hypothetical protein
LLWKLETRVDDRATHAILAFTERGLGKTHDRKTRQTTGQQYLDGNRRRFQAELGTALQYSETHEPQGCGDSVAFIISPPWRCLLRVIIGLNG